MSTAPRTRSGRAATADTHLGQCSGMTPEKEQGWIVSVDLGTPDPEPEFGFDGVTYRWRGQLTDAEMVGLVRAHGGRLSKVGGIRCGPTVSVGSLHGQAMVE